VVGAAPRKHQAPRRDEPRAENVPRGVEASDLDRITHAERVDRLRSGEQQPLVAAEVAGADQSPNALAARLGNKDRPSPSGPVERAEPSHARRLASTDDIADLAKTRLGGGRFVPVAQTLLNRPLEPIAPEPESRVDRALRSLRRVTSSGRYLPQVDGIRLIAITSVFFFHVHRYLNEDLAPGGRVLNSSLHPTDVLGALMRQGRLGVMVFFTLSGFILALPFASNRLGEGRAVKLSKYFLRRITRIEPPYLISLALVALFAGEIGLWATNRGVLPRFLAGAWYGHAMVFGDSNRLNPPYWTLEIEVQFYVVAPLLATVFLLRSRVSRRFLLAAAGVSATLIQAAYGYRLERGHAFGILPSYIQWFLIGLLIADIFVADWKQRPTTTYRWDIVSVVGWPVFFLMGSRSDLLTYVLIPWMLLPLFVAVFRGTLTSRALANRWVTTIGGMTYSIYLIHTPIIALLVPHTGGIFSDVFSTHNALLQVVVLAPIVLTASLVFYLLVERPCMNPQWPLKLARRFTRPPAPGSHRTEARHARQS
jgi:peptidoglycan/LPS O-acetylase OafA/YrhL